MSTENCEETYTTSVLIVKTSCANYDCVITDL